MTRDLRLIFLSASAAILLAIPAAGAAEPAMSTDEAFAKLRTYEHGQDDRALHRIQELAAASPGERRALAGRMGALLSDPGTTAAAKGFICIQLRRIGTEAQVPVLEKMLADPATVEMAREALESIPGEASLKALRGALDRLQGAARIGAIHSLGVRHDEGSLEELVKLAFHPDRQTAAAVAWALGQIDRKAEEAIQEKSWRPDQPLPSRLAALMGLYRTREPGKRLDLLREALQSDARLLQLSALSLISRDATVWLGDGAARDMVAALVESADEPVRLAAIATLGDVGGAASVAVLARIAAASQDAAGKAAAKGLTALCGPGVDAALSEGAWKGEPALRAVLLRALAERASDGAAAALIGAAREPDRTVRRAGLEALAALASPAAYPDLIELLASVPAEDATEARKAVLATAEGIAGLAERARPVISGLEKAGDEGKARLLEVLSAIGGPTALGAVRASLGQVSPAVREAAFKALLDWPDASAAGDLLDLAKAAPDRARRSEALRSYLRLALTSKGAQDRSKMLEETRVLAATAEGKKVLLDRLADAADPGALRIASSFLADPEAGAEAAAATLKIARGLAYVQPAAVRDAMKGLLGSTSDAALKERAQAIIAETEKAPADPRTALIRDPDRSEKRKKELRGKAPKGFRLASYLDCGPDVTDALPGGPSLRLVAGDPHIWEGSERAAPIQFATVAYQGQEVLFEAGGLKPQGSYRLGFSFWDYDSNGRIESVWMATGMGERETQAMGKTDLPGFLGRNEPPLEKVVAVPRDLYPDGALRIAFRNERGPNAVVSELWLFEKGDIVAAEPAAAQAAAPTAAQAAGGVKVLLLTGDDYPGHLWRQTAPILAEGLRKDPRLRVTVVEKPEFLASPDLPTFDVIVLHWMNWEKPDPGPAARENLRRFVSDGKGLVIVHFACGAFQDWPEFRSLAGRSYDPKLRPHDPYGTFRVDIRAPDHPVVKGLSPFDTQDELYTCLAGDRPIEVLATARSKVDGKDYPMAFVLPYGKGRVFHTPLGHDVKALATPGTAELLRRACAWTGRIPCVP